VYQLLPLNFVIQIILNIKSICTIRFVGIKRTFLPPLGYRKISQIFNEEGLKTCRNSVFTNSIVHSIYKRGKIREERVNREDIVVVSQPTIEVINLF
jgi:hypothetical protein